MIDILIMAYPHVEWNDESKGDFSVAVTFGDIPLICLLTIPKYAFAQIEYDTELILEHEIIGLLLETMCKGAHGRFDALFPYIHNLKELWRQESDFPRRPGREGARLSHPEGRNPTRSVMSEACPG